MKHASVPDLSERIDRLRGSDQPYVLATVVRTISVTAAKAGAKAVIDASGEIVAGWIGGGCARGAVLKAARAAFEDGEARLISIQPADLLAERGVAAGDERDGIRFASNMCPSQGTMDIFIEPVLPRPRLVIFGASPVARALADLAPAIGFDISVCAPAEDFSAFPGSPRALRGAEDAAALTGKLYLVVSTQGKGDLAALEEALKVPARHVGFVGSRRKIAALREKLAEKGVTDADLGRVKGPAGLDLGAITPEEIALSIVAELLALRRRGQRHDPSGDGADAG